MLLNPVAVDQASQSNRKAGPFASENPFDQLPFRPVTVDDRFGATNFAGYPAQCAGHLGDAFLFFGQPPDVSQAQARRLVADRRFRYRHAIADPGHPGYRRFSRLYLPLEFLRNTHHCREPILFSAEDELILQAAIKGVVGVENADGRNAGLADPASREVGSYH